MLMSNSCKSRRQSIFLFNHSPYSDREEQETNWRFKECHGQEEMDGRGEMRGRCKEGGGEHREDATNDLESGAPTAERTLPKPAH